VDWQSLSTVDVDEVVATINISTLQQVVDNLTFSDIR